MGAVLVAAGCEDPREDAPVSEAPEKVAPVEEAPVEAPAPVEEAPMEAPAPVEEAPVEAPAKEVPPSVPPQVVQPLGVDWLRDTRQPRTVEALYAKGLTGQPTIPFDGYVACKVTVLTRRWDDVVFGSKVGELPDIRVIGMGRAVVLPENLTSGIVGFPGVHIEAGSRIELDIDDVDGLVNDDIEEVTLTVAGGFPLEAKVGDAEVRCVGVPAEAYAKDLAGRRAAAESAIRRVETETADVAQSESTHAALAAAREAVRQVAMFAGGEEVQALALRLARAQAAWKVRLFAALDASIAANSEGWRSLASVKIRAAPGQPGAFEILAEKPLRYEWAARRLGSLRLWYIDEEGQREVPTFPALTVDGERLDAFNEHVPGGKTVVLGAPTGVSRVAYVGFAERKQAHYFRLAK
jgi:hypothetical protein